MYLQAEDQEPPNKNSLDNDDVQAADHAAVKMETDEAVGNLFHEDSNESNETILPCNGNDFLKRFSKI